MQIGYARISTNDQPLDQQIEALKKSGCDDIFTDIASGSKKRRPGLEKAMRALEEEDTLVVWKLDRLGRSLSHLVKTVESLGTRGINFRSLSDPIDTSTPSGKMVFGIFASLAEFELDLIKERTNAGLAAARARGKKGGRPPLLNKSQMNSLKILYESKNHPVRDICRQLKISRKTLYNYLEKMDSI